MSKITCCCTTMEAKPCLCQVKHKISLFCPSTVTHFAHFAAHFVRGGQRDDHRLNRKRLRAILLLDKDLAIHFAFILKNTSSQQRHLLENTRMAVTSYHISPELKKIWHCEKFRHVGRILSRMKCCHGKK